MPIPISNEVAAALARFFHGGDGPSHSVLTRAFTAAGYAADDPHAPSLGVPNKEQRVLAIFAAAQRRQSGARKLVDELLTALRLDGVFGPTADAENASRAQLLRAALVHVGWNLTSDGRLERLGEIDLTTGGRAALDEQLARLRRNAEDPAVLIGGAKDLLESIAKFVLEESERLPDRRVDFPEALALAFEKLGLLPATVDPTVAGARQIRAIYQSARTIANTVNELRNLQGTGHGRTLPTGVSVEAARFVIREATHVAELMLSVHDHQQRH